MAKKVQKKHFKFQTLTDAVAAMEALWDYQDKQSMHRTPLNLAAVGNNADISVGNAYLADESMVIQFLNAQFAGKFTIHDTKQVTTWLDGVLG